MNLRARDILSAARVRAVQRHPYLAAALFSLRPCETPGLNTMAVNAKWVLLYDPTRVEEWGSIGTAAILVHEVQHLLRDHHGRFTSWLSYTQAVNTLSSISGEPAEVSERKLQLLFNIAGDAEINDDIIAAGWKLPEAKGEQMVLPARLKLADKLTAEEYADELLKRRKPEGGSGAGPQGGGGGKQPGQQPSGSSSEPGEGDGSGTPGCGGSCGVCAGKDIDSKLPADAPQGMDEVEAGIVRVQTAHEVAEHAKAHGRGSVPAGLLVWADKQLAPPKVDWRKQLRAQVRNAVATATGADDYTYRRRSRREPVLRIALGRRSPIMPGLHRPVPTVKVVLDTSGSMSGSPLETALAEVLGIVKALAVPVEVLAVDAAVHAVQKVNGVADLSKVAFGGGGTDMRVGITKADEDGKVSIIVVLTDGYTPWPAAHEMPKAKLVAAVVTGTDVPSYIRNVVRIEEN